MGGVRIGALIIVRDMANVIPAAVRSLSWLDALYLFDDGSSDDSVKRALDCAAMPVHVERTTLPAPMFEYGELSVRNTLIRKAFQTLRTDYLVLLDADELLDYRLRPYIESLGSGGFNSIALTCNHLYDPQSYLHVFEAECNGVTMVDPHIRVITPGLEFIEGVYPGCGHPYIAASDRTFCLDGPFHFHLKYWCESTYSNQSLDFLPPKVTEESAGNHLRKLRYSIPGNILDLVNSIDWS